MREETGKDKAMIPVEKLYESISDIDDGFIEEADAFMFQKGAVNRLAGFSKKYRRGILRAGSLAACLCLLIFGGGSLIKSMFSMKQDAPEEARDDVKLENQQTALAPLPELYSNFGVFRAEQIAKVAEVDGDLTGSTGASLSNIITETDAISSFYSNSLITEKESDIALDDDTFSNYYLPEVMTKEELTVAEDILAAEERSIYIETVGGEQFILNYYPSYGWLYSETFRMYYSVGEGFRKWMEEFMAE